MKLHDSNLICFYFIIYIILIEREEHKNILLSHYKKKKKWIILRYLRNFYLCGYLLKKNRISSSEF